MESLSEEFLQAIVNNNKTCTEATVTYLIVISTSLQRTVTTELYYISGDCALIPRQSTNCNQKHGGFWPNLRHFDVTVSLFSCRTPLTRYLSGKNLSMSRGQWVAQ